VPVNVYKRKSEELGSISAPYYLCSEYCSSGINPIHAVFLVYGREAVMPFEAELRSESEYRNVEEMIDFVKKARIMAGARVAGSQENQSKYVNQKRRDAEFKVGDSVLIREFIKKKKSHKARAILLWTLHSDGQNLKS